MPLIEVLEVTDLRSSYKFQF